MIIKMNTRPQIGDERIAEQFLYLPKTINNELRWWIKVKYREQYKTIVCGYIDGIFPIPKDMWCPVEWIDTKE